MHLTDLSVGFVASTAIVGNSIPVGAGLALAEKLRGSNAIVVIFIGEGATETGVFAETVNFSAVHKLPVLFVCENNLYSVYTSLEERQPASLDITQKVKHMGIVSSSIDGTNAVEQFEHFQSAITAIREQKEPRFVECRTYRYLEHCGPNNDDHLGYRPKNELQTWKALDPIDTIINSSIKSGNLNDEDICMIDKHVQNDVNAAFDFALSSPFPDQATAYEGIFSAH